MISAESRPLAALIVLGLALRFAGLGFAPYHPDEHRVVNTALAFGLGDPNPHMFYYPTFFLYQLFAACGAYFALGSMLQFFHGADDFLQKFLADPLPVYMIGRALSALYGGLTVWVIARAGRRYGSARTGLLAALLLSTSFLHVRDSHFATVDIALAFYMLVSVHWLFKAMDTGEARALWLAALIAGLATAVKYNAFLLALPIAAAAALTFPAKRLPALALGSAAAMALGFFIGAPFVILDWKSVPPFLVHLRNVSVGFEVPMHRHLWNLGEGMGWPWLALALAGFFVAGPWKKRLVILSLWVPYYLMITRAGQPFERYVLPLVPFCLISAAASFERLLEWARNDAARKALWAVFAGAFALSAAKTVHSDMLFLRADTREEAKRWIESRVPEGSKIAIDVSMHSPRLNASSAQLDEKLAAAASPAKRKKLEALRAAALSPSYELYYFSGSGEFTMEGPFIPQSVDALRDGGIEYLVTSDVMAVQRPEFYSALGGQWRPAASFDPRRKSVPGEKPEAWTYLPIDGRLWNYERPGPRVYVYQRQEGA